MAIPEGDTYQPEKVADKIAETIRIIRIRVIKMQKALFKERKFTMREYNKRKNRIIAHVSKNAGLKYSWIKKIINCER